MRDAGIEMQEHLTLPAQVFNQPLFHERFCLMALFQIPVARQGQMKIDVMTVT